MYFVYILYSVNHDTYYVGQTNDLQSRLIRHNAGYENYTSKYVPWILKGYVEKQTRSEALVLEKKLKNLNRNRLELFIEKYCNRFGGADEA